MSDIEIIKKYRSIENYIYELEQENTNLKQALNEIREYINKINDWQVCSKYDCIYRDNVLDILQIIDKVLRDGNSENS